MIWRSVVFIYLVITSLSFSKVQTQQTTPSRKAIICLTYDDGLESHLATVLPQLDSFGFKATFFLNSIKGASSQIGETSPAIAGWTTAALHGHELANHTLFHACPEAVGWQKPYAIESYTVARIITEIKAENVILSLLDPERKKRAFAFPCNNYLVHDTDYTTIIKRESLVTYARAGGDRTSVVTDFKKLNSMKVPSWLVEEGTTAEELIAFAKKVKEAGGMGVYQFHGIGSEFFRVSKEAHKALLEYLKKNEADYQVLTFSEAINLIKSK
jgi:peptidoglycan-N-acetylglucosamine deacetylase